MQYFFTEMVKSPLFQLSDTYGNFKKHVLAPRQKDERSMALMFNGTKYELSEKYSDMTKIVFMACFYSSIFPAGFFFASGTLMVYYLTDKFSLLKSWRQIPQVGDDIEKLNQAFFFPSTLLVFAFMASYSYASFPYDNACKLDSKVSSNYVGIHNITEFNDKVSHIVEVKSGQHNYFFCNQNYIQAAHFPALPSKQPQNGQWMNDGQEDLVYFFACTSILLLILIVLYLLRTSCILPYLRLFRKTYKPVGLSSQSPSYSELSYVTAYLPKIKAKEFPVPFLSCDISGVNIDEVAWCNPAEAADNHNLVYDIMELDPNYDPDVLSRVSTFRYFPVNKDDGVSGQLST